MSIDFLQKIFNESSTSDAIAYAGKIFSYSDLIERLDSWKLELDSQGVTSGDVVSVIGDFSMNSISLLLELINRNCIVVPMLMSVTLEREKESNEIAKVQYRYRFDQDDSYKFDRVSDRSNDYDLYNILREDLKPGLVLFSSGTSGQPKAAVHDFSLLLEKFKTPRKSLRILNFLLFDHWGGLNTVLHTLSNAGLVLTVDNRSPTRICELIEKYHVEVLPASPSFLNLLLISGSYKKYDLSSLKIISYGTEPMPPVTLERLNSIFKDTKIQQTYGLIELGVLRAKSKSSDSLWVKVGGEGVETRVVDGLLQIKARSAMLGYLNAPSPFTEDGWFMTGDAVEVSGEWLKILGRKSELINVGGEKVYPQEVENCILKMDNVKEVLVYKEKNPILGNVVCVKILLENAEDHKLAKKRIRRLCIENLEKFKVPVKYDFVEESMLGARMKKSRS